MSLSNIVLASGRSIELSDLRTSSTYGSMLEGYPCKPINDMKVTGAVRTAERDFPTLPVHLVPPSREYPDQTGGAFGPVEVLPAVRCVGVFGSTAIDPDHDPVLYRSALVVVWFQPTADVPSGESAVLGDISWEEVARDHEL
ncbi:hypothetical protein [Streptomyces sp. CBMA152]|uniref:hypothetical protein n=1 Tax=Streptomyces sp. CBMA152 TaxID=1896312 RepID=UPI0016603262|nr:hypothetical protein [Streptomyces sp. CBMA152]MBD0742804.1 hypothetical protein [Streptomyces sp. CBMA152]